MKYLPKKLFVYGTLQIPPGQAGAKPGLPARIIAGQVGGKLYDLGAYPGASFDEEAAPIVGQLQDYSHMTDIPWLRHLKSLDAYEGSAFHRTRVEVKLPDGTIEEAWSYQFIPVDGLSDDLLVPDGRWQP